MKHTYKVHNKKQRLSLKEVRVLKPIAFFLTSVVCPLSPGKTALLHPLNDLKVIEVPISQTDLTRITVEEDRIKHVFGVRGDYEMEVDETMGQVFIRPLEHSLKPISLTLTTEGGHTQDLRLLPQNKPPDALILQKSDPKKSNVLSVQTTTSHDIVGYESVHNDITRHGIARNDIEELLYACAQGRIPLGYHSVKLEIPKPGAPYPLISEITNGKLRGLTFEVKNWATIPWILSESGFAEKLGLNIVAVLMPQKLLVPRERMHVYVALRS